MLSGVVSQWIGAPGVIQLFKLKNYQDQRQTQLTEAEAEIARLTFDVERLETSRTAQLHEIRKVLGYAAPNELIFDFTR